MGGKEKQAKRPLGQSLKSFVGDGSSYRGDLIELRGRESVTVRGGGTILTYTPTVIRLAYGREVLRIEGEDLSCSSYFLGAVRVDGRIVSFGFEEDGR